MQAKSGVHLSLGIYFLNHKVIAYVYRRNIKNLTEPTLHIMLHKSVAKVMKKEKFLSERDLYFLLLIYGYNKTFGRDCRPTDIAPLRSGYRSADMYASIKALMLRGDIEEVRRFKRFKADAGASYNYTRQGTRLIDRYNHLMKMFYEFFLENKRIPEMRELEPTIWDKMMNQP